MPGGQGGGGGACRWAAGLSLAAYSIKEFGTDSSGLQTQGLDGGLSLDIKSPFSFGGDPEL